MGNIHRNLETYEQRNPDNATTWFKNTPEGNDIYRQMTFYREIAAKYALQLYKSECDDVPGEIIYEDAFQIAVKNTPPDLKVKTTELR